MNLDTSRWKWFWLNMLFDIQGAKNTQPDELEGPGISPLISASTENNGTIGHYSTYKEKGNVLTIESACKGFCIYQKENFSALAHIIKLVPKSAGGEIQKRKKINKEQ